MLALIMLPSAKDVAGPSGASVQVAIQTQAGVPWANSEPIATGGKTSVNFTVPLPPPGAYQASAQLMDASGNLLSQAGPTSFTVPTQTNPVVLTMPSNLYTMVVTDSTGLQYPNEPTIHSRGIRPLHYEYLLISDLLDGECRGSKRVDHCDTKRNCYFTCCPAYTRSQPPITQ